MTLLWMFFQSARDDEQYADVVNGLEIGTLGVRRNKDSVGRTCRLKTRHEEHTERYKDTASEED